MPLFCYLVFLPGPCSAGFAAERCRGCGKGGRTVPGLRQGRQDCAGTAATGAAVAPRFRPLKSMVLVPVI